MTDITSSHEITEKSVILQQHFLDPYYPHNVCARIPTITFFAVTIIFTFTFTYFIIFHFPFELHVVILSLHLQSHEV